MRVHTTGCVLLLALAGCMFPEVDLPGDDDGYRPFRDQWRVELDAPIDFEGADAFESLVVGGLPYDDDFSNRGDVIVRFHDEDRIVVELRRFTHAPSREAAQEQLDRLTLWAYRGGEAPQRPEQMTYPRPCVGDDGTVGDGCGLRVYYEGRSQPERSGADMRITLPARFAGKLDVVTEDLIADASYLNRGDVCIEPTRAQVNVTLARGRAWASIAEPTVAPSAVPRMTISGNAADITVDVPASMRSSILTSYVDDAERAERCWADLDVAGFVAVDTTFGADRSSIQAIAGPEAEPEAFDAFVNTLANACDVVAFSEGPEEWTGDPQDQPVEVRGVMTVCNDCVRVQSCDEWIDG